MELQRYPSGRDDRVTVPSIVHDVLRSPGQPLDEPTRSFFEPRFGHDFSKVRVHTGDRAAASARAVDAFAYTVGRDIVFSAGKYRPEAMEGRRLLAHELVHVTQQCDARISPSRRLKVGLAHDPHEQEADRVAERLVPANLMEPGGDPFRGPGSDRRTGATPGMLANAKPRKADATSCAPALHQLGPDEDESPESSGDSLLHQSGTCVNGGGGSDCDPATGVFGLQHNDNTCCTTDCTAAHEAVHKTDVDGWGCCKAYSVTYNAKGADKAALHTKYVNWINSIRAITECHAYSNDVTCADALAKTKDCNGKGKGTDCCKDIVDYKARYGALAKSNCKAAPAKAPPCPAF